MPQGRPLTVPDDGLTTRQPVATRPLLAVHTGADEGQVDRGVRDGTARLEPGLAIAVFQFVKSAKWKVGEEAAFRALGRLHDETGEGGPVEWHKMGEGWSWSRKQGTDVDHAAAAAPRAGRRSARRLAEQRTTSTCSTSSPTR